MWALLHDTALHQKNVALAAFTATKYIHIYVSLPYSSAQPSKFWAENEPNLTFLVHDNCWTHRHVIDDRDRQFKLASTQKTMPQRGSPGVGSPNGTLFPPTLPYCHEQDCLSATLGSYTSKQKRELYLPHTLTT